MDSGLHVPPCISQGLFGLCLGAPAWTGSAQDPYNEVKANAVDGACTFALAIQTPAQHDVGVFNRKLQTR